MTSSSDERPALRIGNAERDAAYAALSAHLDAGRLDPDEYGERYGRASVARTRPELEALFVDLPLPHPRFEVAAPIAAAPSWTTGGPVGGSRRSPSWRLMPALFCLIPVIALIVTISTGFGFVFFLVPLTAILLRRGFGHRGYGRRGYRHRGGWPSYYG